MNGNSLAYPVGIKLWERGISVNIILYPPQSEASRESMARKVAALHAQTVAEYLRAAHMSPADRGRLLDAITDEKRHQPGHSCLG